METEKVKLNDQIILLRRCVKIAKVHTVRRLFRQMKMWREKKGKTEEATKKNQRKAERLKEEISIITKADPDIISKMALKQEKDWKGVICQKDITLEERSFAHLISHKKIQEKVTQFRDANPDWQSWMPSTLQRWERRQQAKIERMSSAPLKDKSTNSEKEEDLMSSLQDSTDEIQNDEKKPESVGQKHFNKTNLSPDNVIKENKKKVRSKNKKGKPDKQMPKNLKLRTKADEYKDAISKFLTKPKNIIDRVEGNMEITEINLDKLEDQETLPVHRISRLDANVSTDDVPKPEKKLKDAFFLGTASDDSDQESHSETEHTLSSEDEQSSIKPKSQFISNLSGNKGDDFSQLRKRINPKFFSKQDPRKGINQRWKKGTNKQFDKKPHRNKERFSCRTDSSKTEDCMQDSKLHPSWEAKRKMKQTTMLPFQGKKIRFDVNN